MSEYKAEKFDARDEVFVVKPHFEDKGFKEGCVYTIKEITRNSRGENGYKFENNACFWFDDELKPAELKKGDIVELNLDCPLKSIFRSNKLYSFSGTKKLLTGEISILAGREYKVVKAFTNIENDTGLILKGINESNEIGYLDAPLFKLVRRPKETKEITIEELEKHYGCKVKIVKENEK